MSSKPKFCSNCGEKLDPNAEGKCPKCGVDLQVGYVQQTPVVEQLPHKSPRTAALIALIGGLFGLPGIGHIYVGKVGRGIVILIIGIILYALVALVATSIFNGQRPIGMEWLIIIGIIIGYFVLFIWQIFKAKKLAKKFNELVRT